VAGPARRAGTNNTPKGFRTRKTTRQRGPTNSLKATGLSRGSLRSLQPAACGGRSVRAGLAPPADSAASGKNGCIFAQDLSIIGKRQRLTARIGWPACPPTPVHKCPTGTCYGGVTRRPDGRSEQLCAQLLATTVWRTAGAVTEVGTVTARPCRPAYYSLVARAGACRGRASSRREKRPLASNELSGAKAIQGCKSDVRTAKVQRR
jgi:hypothetical protein